MTATGHVIRAAQEAGCFNDEIVPLTAQQIACSDDHYPGGHFQGSWPERVDMT